MDNLEEKARRYATSAHARINQMRKYSLKPYEVHLRAVSGLVASVTDDKAMIAASWLHDTVEDTPATFEDLEREFGTDVMKLVKELSDVSKPGDGNRAMRKAIDRQHLSGASPRAKTIKLADIIDNCEDICRHDPKFGKVYLFEMQALLEVLQEGNQSLYGRAVKKMVDFEKKLSIVSHATGNSIRLEKAVEDAKGLIQGSHGLRLFTAAFAARDIQEPLISFDMESLPGLLRRIAAGPPAPGVGIRTDGVVTGYLTTEDLSDEKTKQIRPIDPRQTVELEASLADVIHVLTHFTFCFVTIDGAVIGVIGRGDIEKPVVRMWLFGIIILIEMLVVNLIRKAWPDGRWVSLVSEGRLEKAKKLQEERVRRGFDADLVDCLQFSDKLQIVFHEPSFVENAGFPSASAAKRAMKDLESLRNDLAHGQDISKHDWPPIVRLAQRIQHLYGG